MIDTYYVCFLVDELSDEEVVAASASIGDHVEFESSPLDGSGKQVTQTIQTELSDDDWIEFTFDEYTEYSVGVPPAELAEGTDPDFLLTVHIDGTSRLENESEEIEARIDILVDMVAEIIPIIEPEYGWAMFFSDDHLSKVKPADWPILDHIEGVSWISVFGPSLVEDLGGRERMLEAPAARVEAFETGHVLVVKTEDFSARPRVTYTVAQYLLEVADAEAVDAEATDETLTLDDPFREFEPGEIGADVVIEKDAVGGDISDDDLQLRRVRLDDNGSLWDLETDSFVRRLYGPEGQIGSLPPGVTTDDELFPPLALNGVPVEFVRLDHPDDENVITKCLSLDVDMNTFEFLVRLSSSVLNGGYDAEDIESVENILDSVSSLEDLDGIGRLLDQL